MAGLGRDNFQLAVVGLDDFPADGQSQSQTHVARGEKRRGRFSRGLGGKAGPVVLNFNLNVRRAAAGGIGVQRDADFRLLGIRLERIEHDFSQRVFERGAVAGNDHGLAAIFKLQFAGIGGLMFARFLVGLLNQFSNGERLLFDVPFARKKTHLIDQPRDALDAVGEGLIQ